MAIALTCGGVATSREVVQSRDLSRFFAIAKFLVHRRADARMVSARAARTARSQRVSSLFCAHIHRPLSGVGVFFVALV